MEEDRGGEDVGPGDNETDEDGEGDRSIGVGDTGDSSSEDENSTFSEDLYIRLDIFPQLSRSHHRLHQRKKNSKSLNNPDVFE